MGLLGDKPFSRVSFIAFSAGTASVEYREGDNAIDALMAGAHIVLATPGFPGALFNLAMARSLNGEAERSLQTLEQILARNVDFGADEMDVFAPLHELDDWDSYVARVKALYEPVGTAGKLKMILLFGNIMS